MLSALELAGGFMAGDPRRRDALIVTADNFGTAPDGPLAARRPDFVLGDAPGSAAVLHPRARLRPAARGELDLRTRGRGALHRAGTPLFPPSATTGEAVDFSARAEEFGRMCSADSDLALRLDHRCSSG